MKKFEVSMAIWYSWESSRGVLWVDPQGARHVITVEDGPILPPHIWGEQDFLLLLNRLGSNGWELCNIVSHSDEKGYFTYQAFLKTKAQPSHD